MLNRKSLLKGLFVSGVGLSAALLGSGVSADDDDRYYDREYGHGKHRDYVYDKHRGYRYGKHYGKQKDYRYAKHKDYAYAKPLSLGLRVHANGYHRLPLRKLIEHQHGIDTRNYNLRKVTVRNKSRHHATANLGVGGYETGPVHLYRGVTTIDTPSHKSKGRWTLDVDRARVRWVSVVLEPKRHHYGKRKRYDDRYAYGDHGYRYKKHRRYRY